MVGRKYTLRKHSPPGQRASYTSWIQTTATLGFFVSLIVILGPPLLAGEQAFADWGWRIPVLGSIVLLAISVWIRLSLEEAPLFQKMKAEGKTSKAPIKEAFGEWKNVARNLMTYQKAPRDSGTPVYHMLASALDTKCKFVLRSLWNNFGFFSYRFPDIQLG
ncbi:MAG: MFS transporter [Pseudomonadota bacterium]